MELAKLSLTEFTTRLLEAGQRRAYFIFDPQTHAIRVSHASLEPLARELTDTFVDFDEHEAIFLEVSSSTKALLGAFIHRTKRGQAAGGVRRWHYPSLGDYLRDGLRLSKAMGRKNALAGLWWGGGKGVIALPSNQTHQDRQTRQRLYQEYGALVTSLRGLYVAAEDAGTQAEDMAEIFRTTRHVTCIPPELGGSGNPSQATARGVISGMESALEFLQLGSLEGQRIVMQGAGNVGAAMIDYLLERGVKSVLAGELSKIRVTELQKRFHGQSVEIRETPAHDLSLFEEPCDIFAPNALGGSLNAETINRLKTKIVCGAANNQLLDEAADSQRLQERNIVYVPDFVTNRMGIVSCANEQYGVIPDDPAIERHLERDWEHSVFRVTRQILDEAQRTGVTSTEAANRLADQHSQTLHPIWGHRGATIVTTLIAENWPLLSDSSITEITPGPQ